MSGHLPPEILEALADGAPPEAQAQEHLQSCPDCSRTLGELKVYFTEMKSLRRFQAPPGFAARLRKRVDADAASGWKKIWNAVFLPWRVKIPLQLAGAGLATVLLFWALPQWQDTSTPTTMVYSDSDAGKNEKDATPEPPRPPVPEGLALADKKEGTEKSLEEVGKRGWKAAAKPKAAATIPSQTVGKAEAGNQSLSSSVVSGLARSEQLSGSTDAIAKKSARAQAMGERTLAAAPATTASPEAKRKKSVATPAAAPQPMALAAKKGEDKGDSEVLPKAVESTRTPGHGEPLAASEAADQISTPAKLEFSGDLESSLKALGFKPETRDGVLRFVLKIPTASWDSVKTRLKDLGLDGRMSLRALEASPDSSEVEIK